LELHLIVLIYILAPVGNLIYLSAISQLPVVDIISRMFPTYGTLATIWLFTAPLVALLFYFIHRITWYTFLAHSSLVFVDFFMKLLSAPEVYLNSRNSAYLIGSTLGNVALIALIAYILQKDFRAPYFRALNKSFREHKRIAINHVILLDGKEFPVIDFSPIGCFVPGSFPALVGGSMHKLSFKTEKLVVDCDGRIVRIGDDGLGIQFLHMSGNKKNEIRKLIKDRYSLRHTASTPCSCEVKGENVQGTIQNISTKGCYVKLDPKSFNEGASTTLTFKMDSLDTSIKARIIWVNAVHEFGKPDGIGLEFGKIHHEISRLIHKTYDKSDLTR